MTDIVIGSGPTGVSVASALLARGRNVTMIDGGQRLEQSLQDRQTDFAAHGPDWTRSQAEDYQQPQFETPAGQARRYGSDFAMEPAQSTLEPCADWFALRGSRAAGGLSNLWGGAVLPYRQADIASWPITTDDLKAHYNAVSKFMPVAGTVDRLSKLLPAFDLTAHAALPPGAQAKKLLGLIDETSLDDLGITAGAARNAVASGCKSCGMCLHGCPWGLIYSAAHTLDTLLVQPNFTYRCATIAHSFEETDAGVSVRLATGETITGKRLFIGAGVLETARIMLASAPEPNGELTLLDSQHAFVPMLHRWRSARPDRAPLTTLPQMFVEIDNPTVSPHLVHGQLYTWNEQFARDMITNFGRGMRLTAPVFNTVARRLIVAQLFLHSDHSAKISLSLSGDGRLQPSQIDNPETHDVLKRARRKLAKGMHRVGMTTLGFATRPGPIGSSFHTGGTVPMAKEPKTGQSDQLGRPFGLKNVHLVDASVFPSIPATTITFSAMANAHRIGTLAPD